MSQAEDLLNTLSENIPEHTHSMADADNAFVIDPVTRTIKNMTSGPLILMQRDHKSSVYTFKLPRYIDGHDMSLCNRVKCHFNNIEVSENTGDTFEHADEMELTDLRVDPEDENSVICSWTIPRQATWYAGALGFLLQFVCVDDAGNETYEWHTDEFTDVVVKKGRNNDYVVLEYSAIFEQWRERIFGAGDSVKSELIALTEEKIEAIETEGTTWVEAAKSEGAKQVESVNTTGAAQVEAISNEGLRVFNTIPEDYTTMDKTVDMLTRVAGPVIRQEVEGESIIVKDSAKMPLLGLQMFGKSSQATTNGYQLFDMNQLLVGNVGNATVGTDGNGSFTVKGDGMLTSGGGRFYDSYNVKPGVYHFKLNGERTNPYFYFSVYNSNGRIAETSEDDSVITITEEHVNSEGFYVRFGYYGNVNAEIISGTSRPMIYLDGDGTWEPFSGEKPSPNPEYPQEIVSVENPVTYIYGKNVLNMNAFLNEIFVKNNDGSYTLTKTEAGRFSEVAPIYIPANTTFGLSYIIDDHNAIVYPGSPIFLQFYFEDRTYNTAVLKTPVINRNLVFDKTIVEARLYINADESFGTYATISKLQVEIGTEITDYEDYSSFQSISANAELPGLPVSSGGNYIDENGQQYWCNEIDYARNKYVQRVYTYVVTGEEIVHNNELAEVTEAGNIRIELNGLNLPAPFVSDVANLGLCTHYNYRVTNKTPNSCWVHHHVSTGYGRIRIVETLEKYPTIDDFVVFAKAQYAAGTPITIKYAIATPIETPIPEAELQAYRELHTNYPNTTILNNSGAHMKLAYATDTKTYIDNKFAELQAALTRES